MGYSVQPPRHSWTRTPPSAPQERSDERGRIEAQSLGHLEELDEVEPPLSAFVLRHEGLGTGELLRESRLGDAPTLPGVNELAAEVLVAWSEDGMSQMCAPR
jgi:hypothetical protein